MNLIVCIDKKGGMAFNNRRQSQDKIVREKILELSKDKTLRMNTYSAKQFEDQSSLSISASPQAEASPGDFCFVEDFAPSIENVSNVYLFQWNRKYPFDLSFDIDLKANGFKKVSSEDFAGSSHDEITLEVWTR